MPFYEGFTQIGRGLFWWVYDTYCQTDTSAASYGICYQSVESVYIGRPLFTYSGSSVPACVSNGTCIGIQNPPWDYVITLKDNTSVGKQLILYKTWTIVNTDTGCEGCTERCGRVATKTNTMDENLWFPFKLKTIPFLSGSAVNTYDPMNNSICAVNVFYNPPVGKQIISEWSGSVLAMKIITVINMRNEPNRYYALYSAAYYAQEGSPLVIMPIDYEKEYIVYKELRRAFGYSLNGVDQPGWNADDLIRILRELFHDRAWAVYDDRTYSLYLYNITPDLVPDWLIERIAPLEIKVIKRPSNIEVAKKWLNELNRRNGYNNEKT